MKIKKHSFSLGFFIASVLMIFLLIQPKVAQAAVLESKIIVPLYGNGTVKSSTLSLRVDDSTNVAKLFFQPGDASSVFHKEFGNQFYYSIDIVRQDRTVKFNSYNKGNDLQSKMVNDIDGKQIRYGDILKMQLVEPVKVQVENYNGTIFNSLETKFKDMYYLMTPSGFLPVNDAIVFRTFDNANGVSNGNAIGFQMTSIFSTQLITGSFAAGNDDLITNSNGTFVNDFSSVANADRWKFHNLLSNSPNEYSSLSKYTVTTDHILSSPEVSAKAQPQTTIGNFGNQIQPNKKMPQGNMSGNYGSIYRVYSADTERVLKFAQYGWNKVSQPETYYEYTTDTFNALKELDFNKVTAKEVTIELGSDTSKQSVTNFSNVQDYSKLSSSFNGNLKSDTLGTYNIPIIIKQPLIVNNNYLNHTITSKVTVVDTTKPTGILKNDLSIPINGTLEIKDMFSEVNDNSGKDKVSYEYVGNALDTSKPGDQTVTVRLKDPSGNYSDYNVTVKVMPGNFGIISVDKFTFGKIKAGATSKNIELNSKNSVGISMEDNRGTKAGWRVQAKTSAFMPKVTTTGKTFVAGIKLPKGVATNNGAVSQDLVGHEVTLNGAVQNVVSAPVGKGVDKWSYSFGTVQNPVSLVDIPSTVYVGDYEAAITWSMINAPS